MASYRLKYIAMASCTGLAVSMHLKEDLQLNSAPQNGAAASPAFDGSPPGVCNCLNWKKVYEEGLARCGEGAEGHTMIADNVGKKGICENYPGINNSAFYLNQAHEYCLSMELVSKPVKTHYGFWCYVQGGCRQLGAGHAVNKDLAWKTCTKSDQQLGDLKPQELFSLAKKSGVNHTQIALAAYTWEELKGMFPPQQSARDILLNFAESKGWKRPDYMKKTPLARPKLIQTVTMGGQTWEVTSNKAVCVEGCSDQ